MGTVYTDIKLTKIKDITLSQSGYIKENEVREVNVNAVVDTGAETLCITENIFIKLGLGMERQKMAKVADGRFSTCLVSTPIKIQ